MAKSSTKLGSEPLLGRKFLSLVGLGRTDRKHLLETIETRLIPELALAHLEGTIEPAVCADVRGPPTDEEVATLARIAVDQDVAAALSFIEALASQGISLEVILLQLIAPAARLLGDQWLEDDTTFMQVTEGLSTIQQVVNVLGPSFAPEAPHRGHVVLTTSPLEQHTLGIFLVGEFLRRAGWGVQVAPRMGLGELVDLVHHDRVEVVGISVTSGELFSPVKRMVRAVNDATMNPDMSVMLGGAPEVASYAHDLGVTYCSDAQDAVRWLDERHVT